MNFFEFVKRLRFGTGEDSIDYAKHDARYHGGQYDPATMTCEMREAEAKGDLVDVLNAEQFEEDYKAKKEAERAAGIVRRTVDELATRKYTEDDVRRVDEAMRHVLTAKPMFVGKELRDEAVAMLKGKASSPDELQDRIARYFRHAYPNGIQVPGLGLVHANGNSAASIVSHSQGVMNVPKIVAVAAIRPLLQTARVFLELKGWKGRKWDSVTLASPIDIAGFQSVVEIMAKAYGDGSLELYNVKAIKKDVIGDTLTPHATNLSASREPADAQITPPSLPKPGGDVNRGFSEKSRPTSSAKLPTSNLVRMYMAVHGMLKPQSPKR